MKVVGKGQVRFHGAEDERPHEPGEHPQWQESFVLMLWDTTREVYAFLRVSQVPHKDGGTATAWINFWAPGLQFKHTNVALPFKRSDRTADALSVGDGLCTYRYAGDHHWSVRDAKAGVSAELVFRDAHQGVSFYADASAHFVSETVASHVEGSGVVTGTIKIGDEQFDVSGTGWRDHSWGKRNWTGIRAHRFFSANFGAALHVACISYIGDDGHLTKNGLVIRNDEVQFTTDFSIVAFMGEDAISNRGGRLTITLPDRTYELEFDPVGKAAISVIDGFPCVNSLCRVRAGDMNGVGVAETSNNALGGSKLPFVFPSSPGVIDNGLFTV